MSAFDSVSHFDNGVILILDGLSKAELNGTFVEVGQKVISEADGSIRWTCTPIADESGSQKMAIKEVNLKFPPSVSPSTLKQYDDLCNEGLKLFRKAVNMSGPIKQLEKAKQKFFEAVKLVPQNGKAFQHLGDIAHYTQQPQHAILKFMRRAVANSLKTKEDDRRVFLARIGYSGALGNLLDYHGE